jgi:hypothetical protein
MVLAALGLVVLAVLILAGLRARDDDDDSDGPGGRRRVPVRISIHDRGPRR